MNSKNSTKTTGNQNHKLNTAITAQRRLAKHGDFFFAEYDAIGQKNRGAPVFIIGSKDHEDLIICSCTKYPPRTDYDIPVELKVKTSVRTNKIYTISREQLSFKIPQTVTPEEYKLIIGKVNDSIKP